MHWLTMTFSNHSDHVRLRLNSEHDKARAGPLGNSVLLCVHLTSLVSKGLWFFHQEPLL